MKKIAILATDGFEDVELISCIDVFTREGLVFDLYSVNGTTQIKGKYNSLLNTKDAKNFNEVEYTGILLPGGTLELAKSDLVNETVSNFNKEGKDMYAICAAPKILYDNNVLEGRNFTCWPGLELKNSKQTGVEVSGNVITGKSYLESIEFAFEIVKRNQ